MKKTYQVTGMGCSACSARIEKGVGNMKGVNLCQVNLVANSMVVNFDENVTSSREIMEKVEDLGYGASEEEEHPESVYDEDEKHLRRRLILSVIFALPMMVFPMGNLLKCLMAIAVIIVNGRMLRKGAKGLTMETLILLGVAAAIAIGYYESVVMVLTIVTIGKYIESRAKRKTFSSINLLMDLNPKTVTVVRGRTDEEVSVDSILVGDLVKVKAGDILAFDGKVASGKAMLDQSNITGESRPVPKQLKDQVISGTLVTEGEMIYEVLTVGEDTTLARIISMVEEASNSKAPISKLADKVSSIFVPTVIGLSVIDIIVWLVLGKGISFALLMGISVLVISCPCAMGLATPLSIMVATGRGAREGVLIKSAESLEMLGRANTVVFDKTGTLTDGENLKPHAKEVIDRLHKMKIKTVMMSGDKKEIVEDIAARLGIDEYYYEVLPEDKARYIKKKTIMVGDGVNDAIALTKADVGIAIGRGKDIAVESADVVLMEEDISAVLRAITLGRETLTNIKRSLFWAFFYNILCIPIAGGILYPLTLNPMIAAGAMSLSSICVVLNALTLRKSAN
ncbi:MAG: HAD-IC family P-type ATPase [Clostridia bacterium]|nr:HAD-IC family P-type ATPase [Clostridia bacterium]